jgi:hypothetical protein
MSEVVHEEAEPDDEHGDHLSDLADGSGCTEIWEHLSEQRDD